MVLDDEVRAFLDDKPDSGHPDRTVAQRRTAIRSAGDELFRRHGRAGEDVHSVADVAVPTGTVPLRVRVYRPSSATGLPVHVFLHGGGFWLGSVDEPVNDALCRTRARAADCVVVAVDYRLAPEHPFPTAVEDCYAGLLWAVEHAHEWGGDPERSTIGGVSAGANLAAAVVLACRDRGGPTVDLQLLEVPVLDLSLQTMRTSGVGDDFGITVAEMQWCAELYLAGPAEALQPLASPLLAGDLTGLPPAHIMTAEHDPLRLDGHRYAARLREAGVEVTATEYPGAVHGSLALTGRWPPARRWQQDAADALRRACHR
ncbi:alpha/beta hydrolase [Nakamurella endophytica]|uniref:Lipase/esterase n=1 Tax=Nakamurella endophytica TaxID=1748367 RepID=A0A917SQ94_9ACTN|nr:alpha/beta hydrolase [Nakamurella endophytica]GGL92256.1 putative lipase/esterase [Nakamurella endophytica]